MNKELLELKIIEARINQALRKQNNRHDLIDDIINVVCEKYNVTYVQLKSSSRKAEVRYPRHILFYILHKRYCLTSQYTARLFNRLSHATVLSACKNIQWEIDRNKLIAEHIDKLTKVKNY